MIVLNFYAGLLATALMLLMGRGFIPHIRFRSFRKEDWMRLCAGLFYLIALGSVAWWDVARIGLGWIDVMPASERTIWACTINITRDLLASAGAVAGLVTLWASIPALERHRYSIFTAPFYPRQFQLPWCFSR